MFGRKCCESMLPYFIYNQFLSPLLWAHSMSYNIPWLYDKYFKIAQVVGVFWMKENITIANLTMIVVDDDCNRQETLPEGFLFVCLFVCLYNITKVDSDQICGVSTVRTSNIHSKHDNSMWFRLLNFLNNNISLSMKGNLYRGWNTKKSHQVSESGQNTCSLS